jgi:hypothetical protein
MKLIICDNGDNTVGIIVPALNTGLTIEQIAEKDSYGKPWEIVDTADVDFTDKTFRNAWKAKPGGFRVMLPRAKHIAHARRRRKRGRDFEPFDNEASRPGPMGAAAEASRQLIRDADAVLQANIDISDTVDGLKTLMVSGGLVDTEE